jgi:hypothetical protein
MPDPRGSSLGSFRFTGGRYRLDVEVLSDPSILNTGEPRLIVAADGYAYRRLHKLRKKLLIVSGTLISIGGALLLLLATRMRKAG